MKSRIDEEIGAVHENERGVRCKSRNDWIRLETLQNADHDCELMVCWFSMRFAKIESWRTREGAMLAEAIALMSPTILKAEAPQSHVRLLNT